MDKKWSLKLAILAAPILGGLVWLAMPHHEPEPIYDGQPVSYWINQASRVTLNGAKGDWTGTLKIPQLDSNAVPCLVKALEKKNGPMHNQYTAIWLKLPLPMRKRLPAPVDEGLVRINAVVSLSRLGIAAEPAIPALIGLAGRDQERLTRMVALGALRVIDAENPAAKTALIEATKDNDAEVRTEAIGLLQQFDPSGTPLRKGF